MSQVIIWPMGLPSCNNRNVPEIAIDAVKVASWLTAKINAASGTADFQINNEAEYDAAVLEIERLFDAPLGSRGSLRFDKIAAAIEVYEDKHYPIGAPSEAAMLQYQEEKMLVAA